MPLIDDIQAAAIAPEGDVSSLLRMCKLLAARLKHTEFASWVDSELRGYPQDERLPPYRQIKVYSYGDFVGVDGSTATLQIPVGVLPEAYRESYAVAKLDLAISAYEQLVLSNIGRNESAARLPWPVHLSVKYGSQITRGMQCVSAWRQLPMGAIHLMISEVKTTILGFAIDIQREAPDAGESPVGAARPISEERMTQIFHTHIAGNVGNVANGGSGVSQSASVVVSPGDWASLSRYLSTLGFPDSDAQQLKRDLDASADADTTSTRTTVGKWVGRIVGHVAAASGTAALDVVSSQAAKALADYLGKAIS
ncbi:hypothetical protein [Burkholderia lata]|uniref:AbiTii domain-containing protein n=1 Tax=Burkholderia lata (strain ATCC 17760 / DSM 23089 / LMG 22485 / NCIMB 9086 / R18194 / 383) TaxID=482957 RepID=UPI0014538AF4|nr:hypothetical protein [Burkholderia lata]VWM17653.1 hypothetical protein BLA6992_06499 [Burkholderia lata]